MKKISTFLIVFFVFAVLNTFAQGGLNRQQGVPFKESNSLLYATDIIIDNNASQDQRGANLSIAFNGWAYSVFTVDQGSQKGYNIFRSTDDGASWQYLNGNVLNDYQNVAVDQVVCGSSTSSLYLFQAGIAYFPSSNYYVLYVDEYDAATGYFLGEIFYESSPYRFYDVKIVSDYKFPSLGVSPYSLGLLFSRYGPSADTLVFISSGDGGYSFADRKVLFYTGLYLDKISLSHGECSNFFNGRYFAAWEVKALGARTGQIFVSNSNPYFNSDWLTATRLDDIAGSSMDLCRNPVVACQENYFDNDAANFTTVVLFDRDFSGDGLDYDVIGMYNKLSAGGSGSWTRLDVVNTYDDDFESDINFDPGYNNFLVTYCDSTNQDLVYVVNGMNLIYPSSWGVVNSGYNNTPNLVNPYPKVEINPVYTQVGHVWIGDRPGGNGMAMWDAEYSTVGIPPSGQNAGSFDLAVYPNPCNASATISFSLEKASHITIDILNAYGQKVSTIKDENLSSGEYNVQFDVSTLQAGCYYYNFTSGTAKATGKVVVTH
jgi:hypothetical protein